MQMVTAMAICPYSHHYDDDGDADGDTMDADDDHAIENDDAGETDNVDDTDDDGDGPSHMGAKENVT